MTLDEFMQSSIHNAWLKHGEFKCYLRKDRHFYEGKIETFLTLSNFHSINKKRCNNYVKVNSPKSSGMLRKLEQDLCHHAKEANFFGVYVENILNEWLPDKLIEYGYQFVNKTELMPCMIKKV